MREPIFDKNKGSISVKPIILGYMPKSAYAKGYIQSKVEMESIPEVSVEVWLDRCDEEIDGNVRLTARNLYGDGLAIVTRGACSPKDGCGIGMSKNDTVTILDKDYVNMSKEIEKLKKQILMEKIKMEELEHA